MPQETMLIGALIMNIANGIYKVTISLTFTS